MGLALLKADSRIEYNGKKGTLCGIKDNVVWLQFDDGKNDFVSSDQLSDAYSLGEFKLVRKTQDLVLNPICNQEQLGKLEFYNYCFKKMDELRHSSARDEVKAIISQGVDQFGAPNGKVPSDSTLIARFNEWKAADRNISKVFKGTKAKRRSSLKKACIELAYKVIDEHYLQLNGCTIQDTLVTFWDEFAKLDAELEAQANQAGIKVKNPLGKRMGKSAFYDLVRKLDQYEVTKARKGTKAARHQFRNCNEHYQTFRPLERVEVDAVHLPIGLIVKDEETGEEVIRKPIVYIAFDVHTRLVVGYYVCTGASGAENANAVVQLIKHLCDPFKVEASTGQAWPLVGVPEEIVSDAGSAFVSRWVRAVMLKIGATPVTSEAASPWRKPFVERFNGTLKTQFASQLPGYVGNYQRGEVVDSTIEKLAVMTRDEFVAEFEHYILNVYHRNPHRGLDGHTPLEHYEACKHLVRPAIVQDFSKISAFHGFSTEVSLSREGVQTNTLKFNSTELKQLRKKLMTETRKNASPKVTVLFNPDDVSTVSVVDDYEGELIVVPCMDSRATPGMSLDTFKRRYRSKINDDKHVRYVPPTYTSRGKRKGSSSKQASAHDIDKKRGHQDWEDQLNSSDAIGQHDHSQTQVRESTSASANNDFTPTTNY